MTPSPHHTQAIAVRHRLRSLDDGHSARKEENLDDVKLSSLEDLYDNLALPADRPYVNGVSGAKVRSNFTITKVIDGQNVSVNYDKAGFPDFKPYAVGTPFEFRPTNYTLTGTGSNTTGDFFEANKWAASNPDLAGRFQLIAGSTKCKIKINDVWVECTWHHFQDGRTMFPVPSDIHSAFNHSGGKAIISRELQDLFY